MDAHPNWGPNHRRGAITAVMRVDAETDDFPEFGQRTREWLTPDAALARLEEPELKDIVRAVFAAAV